MYLINFIIYFLLFKKYITKKKNKISIASVLCKGDCTLENVTPSLIVAHVCNYTIEDLYVLLYKTH